MTAPRHHRPPIPMTDTTFWAVSWNQYEPSPHGTPARYRNGCDCPLCLDGEARKNRERRGLESDVLLVECRCGQRNVRVPETDVRRGVERLCHACSPAGSRCIQAVPGDQSQPVERDRP